MLVGQTRDVRAARAVRLGFCESEQAVAQPSTFLSVHSYSTLDAREMTRPNVQAEALPVLFRNAYQDLTKRTGNCSMLSNQLSGLSLGHTDPKCDRGARARYQCDLYGFTITNHRSYTRDSSAEASAAAEVIPMILRTRGSADQSTKAESL